MTRRTCAHPGDCTAKARGRCFRCAPRSAADRARNAAAVKANWQDPEFRAKQAAAVKAARAGAKGVEVPRWVPQDLHAEYLEAAAWQGEEFAASHLRRLKRERERAAWETR